MSSFFLFPCFVFLTSSAPLGVLSLFIGAGVSIGAGLPSWGSLLENMAKEAGLSPADIDRMWSLSFLDQARLLERRLGSVAKLRELIVKQVGASPKFGLMHAMLSMLPSESIVTTNYDTLFERAVRCTEQPMCVLPYESAKGTNKFLLKMHGCVTHPEDIVLTKQDYLHFEHRRAALSSIVQSTLIRTHMLFVGFSLMDENYMKIVDAVLAAERDKSNIHGTALFLFSNAFEKDLNHFLDVYAMAPSLSPGEKEGPHSAGPARKLEVFIDYLLMKASRTTDHLLDAGFQDVLSPGERQFALLLDKILHESTPEVVATEAYQQLRGFIHTRFGGPSSMTPSSSIVLGAPIEVPCLIKPGMMVRKFINRLSKTFLLENLDVAGIYRYVLGDSAPVLTKKLSEVAVDGQVLTVSGLTLLHMLNAGEMLGVIGKSGHRNRVTLHVKLHFLPNKTSNNHPENPTLVKCHYWSAIGVCRRGYTCSMLHEGIPPSNRGRNPTSLVLPPEEEAGIIVENDNNAVGHVQIQEMLPGEEQHLQINPPPPILPQEQCIPVQIVHVAHHHTEDK